MNDAMQLCSGCRRHVLPHAPRCPFCDARLGTTSALPLAALLVIAGACTDRTAEQDGDGDTSSASAGDDAPATTMNDDRGDSPPMTDTGITSAADESTGGTTTGASTDDGSVSAGFIYGAPDGGGTILECDLWAQDCPQGEKCMPWANDGGSAWNATRCSPLDPDPAEVGESCTVEGSGVSGIDDCELGAMCWDVDPDTNTGTCVAFCTGSPRDPFCAQGTTCAQSNEGVLILCLPTCDPVLDDCPDGQVCAPIGEGFACVPSGVPDPGSYGQSCEFIAQCNPGLFCANADDVPGCETTSCCSDFCDITAADPDAACTGAAEGQVCLPWYEQGEAPDGFEHVGGCVIP